jgi:hypothetical protein
MKKSLIFSLIFIMFLSAYAQQLTVEKTIPEQVKAETLRNIVIYPSYIQETDSYQWRVRVSLRDGQKGEVPFSDFFGSYTETQKNTVKAFLRLVVRLCLNVAADKVTGDVIE